MGRRSTFEKIPKDRYFTPYEAVLPLLPHLEPRTHFIEPCAGDGRLVRHLERHGHFCVDAFDQEPGHESVGQADAMTEELEIRPGEMVITNFPWTRSLLHPLIWRFCLRAPTWFLLDAEWVHTRQSAPFMPHIRKIVSVGRVKWIEGSKMTGKDSCVWILATPEQGDCVFYGRTA